MEESVAGLTLLYKKIGAVSCVGSDFLSEHFIPGYEAGLELVMCKYQ